MRVPTRPSCTFLFESLDAPCLAYLALCATYRTRRAVTTYKPPASSANTETLRPGRGVTAVECDRVRDTSYFQYVRFTTWFTKCSAWHVTHYGLRGAFAVHKGSATASVTVCTQPEAAVKAVATRLHAPKGEGRVRGVLATGALPSLRIWQHRRHLRRRFPCIPLLSPSRTAWLVARAPHATALALCNSAAQRA